MEKIKFHKGIEATTTISLVECIEHIAQFFIDLLRIRVKKYYCVQWLPRGVLIKYYAQKSRYWSIEEQLEYKNIKVFLM